MGGWQKKLEILGVAVACATVGSWLLAPGILRHFAFDTPFFFETLRVNPERIQEGEGFAYRLRNAGPGSWDLRWTEVREDGVLLRPRTVAEIREHGDGAFHVRLDAIHFAPTGNGDPRTGDRVYTLRRPIELSLSWFYTVAGMLGGATVVLCAWLGVGLVRRTRVGAMVIHGVLTVLAFLAVNQLLDRTLPPSDDDLAGQKMRQFLEQKDQVDTIFLGSSRPYRNLDPEVFDAAFARRGLERRSFNFGVPNMRMAEVDHLLRWILRQQPARLRWLLVEPEPDVLLIEGENLYSDREVRWHDAEALRFLGGEIWAQPGPSPTKLLEIHHHLGPFAMRETHLGRGSRAVAQVFAAPHPPWWRQGFLSLDEEFRVNRTREIQRTYNRLHRHIPQYLRLIEDVAAEPTVGEPRDESELKFLARLRQRADRHGLRLAFLLSPQPHRRPNIIWAHEQGIVETLLRFDDPNRYRKYFDPSWRFDRHHLNAEGAKHFTEEVVGRLLEEGWGEEGWRENGAREGVRAP